ncbi:hypothetical protein [Bradyrhizobium sp. CCBAU 51753]|uniref:hypothetical protein n=1 Tax=Bradyrhizobium sp. CCBAU 51753 TaxID=1325100 RepID=UPI00188A34D1|nr:hypothetical protein [Bradyrhizobium sp. CCBAU 51753]
MIDGIAQFAASNCNAAASGGGLSAAGSARRRCLDPLEVDLDFDRAPVAVAIRCQVMHFATA